jgi:hypothetical protein
MKFGKQSILLVIISLFILSFSLPQAIQNKKYDEASSESKSTETEEVDDLIKVSEEKEINQYHHLFAFFQFTSIINRYEIHVDYFEYYLEIFLPPPDLLA